jgi:hypothetical protein
LLADPDSRTIQAYGVLNREATGMQKGFARPGYYFIDSSGIIREKFFESRLPVIRENVPVFDGTFRISQDAKVSSTSEFWGSLGKDGKTFTIVGKLEYPACDKTLCYPPTSVPVKWQFEVFPLDRTRAPLEIRHK